VQPQEKHILHTWHQNAGPWIEAIAHYEIESRNLVTNQAVIDAVMALAPKSIWDVGCGKGWLCRAFEQKGLATYGTDAIRRLINAAAAKGGDYRVATYEQIMEPDFMPPQNFEAVVFNFYCLVMKQLVRCWKPSAQLLYQVAM